MDKETILDYVTETPGNTNRNVLGSMLNQFAKGSGGGFYPVTVYAVDPLESDDTLPDAPEGTTGEWHLMANYGLSLTKGGTALKFSELIELFKESPVLMLVLPGYVGDLCVVQLPIFAETAYKVEEMGAITAEAHIDYNGSMYGIFGEFY